MWLNFILIFSYNVVPATFIYYNTSIFSGVYVYLEVELPVVALLASIIIGSLLAQLCMHDSSYVLLSTSLFSLLTAARHKRMKQLKREIKEARRKIAVRDRLRTSSAVSSSGMRTKFSAFCLKFTDLLSNVNHVGSVAVYTEVY